MRPTLLRVLVLVAIASPATAQQSRTPLKPPVLTADSAARAIADSIALMKEFEKLTTAAKPAPAANNSALRKHQHTDDARLQRSRRPRRRPVAEA
jgi:hypothetical protein